MHKSLTRAQKIVAYSALCAVLAWTVFGMFVIWLMMTQPKG